MGGVYIGEGRVELNLVVRGDMEEGTCALEKKVKKKWIPSPPQSGLLGPLHIIRSQTGVS